MMYFKLNKMEKDMIKRAQEITCTDYEIIDNLDLINVVNLFDVIDELISCYDNKEEEFEDLERDLQDNYRPITKSEMYE